MNVCGIRSKLASEEFDNYVRGFDVIILTETKLDEVDILEIPGYKIFRKDRKVCSVRASGGVCIMVRNEIADHCVLIQSESKHSVWCKVNKDILNIDKDLICGACYIPPENSRFSSLALFDELEAEILALGVEYDCYMCIGGDFNAHVGNLLDFVVTDISDDITGGSELEGVSLPIRRSAERVPINNFGRRLIELCISLGIHIVNGRCGTDGNVGQNTCKERSIDDYFIMSPELFKSVTEFRVEYFNMLYSDIHSPVVMEVELGLPSVRTQNVKKVNDKIMWNDDRGEVFVQNLDQSVINEILEWSQEKLDDAVNVDELDRVMAKFQSVMKISAEKTFVKKGAAPGQNSTGRPKSHKPWYDKECKMQKLAFQRAQFNLKQVDSVENKAAVKREGKRYKKVLKKCRVKFNKSKVDKLLRLQTDNPHEFWKALRLKPKGHSFPDELSIESLYEHFKSLNERPPEDYGEDDFLAGDGDERVLYETDMLDRNITKEEILREIKCLKSRKACGLDEIKNEFIIASAHRFIDFYCNIFNIVLNSGVVPSVWASGVIKSIYKKGDPKRPENYRGISLLSCLGKLFTSVLNRRLTELVKEFEIVGKEQAGFRAGYSTLDHAFTLKCLVDLFLSKGKRLYVAFVDFRQAFDKIWRIGLWKKLLKTGVKGKILDVIKNLYSSAKSCVEKGGLYSEFFPCEIGVRQGENLSPLLFSLFLNDFESFLHDRGFYGPSHLNAVCQCEYLNELGVFLKLAVLLYADDMILMADSPEGLQRSLDALSEYCKIWKLEVNTSKTKVMIFSRGSLRQNLPVFTYGEGELEIVKEFPYLGIVFSGNGKFHSSVKHNYNKGQRAMFALLRACRNLSFPIHLCLHLFDKMVVPVLLYGSEIWSNQKIDLLERVQLKFCKYLLKLPMRTPSVMVYGELGRYPLILDVKLKQIVFWSRLNNCTDEKWSTIMMKLVKEHTDKGYLINGLGCTIKSILNNCGLTALWDNPMAMSSRHLKFSISQILRDQFAQNWKERIMEERNCAVYRLFKQDWCFEPYLRKLSYTYIYDLARLRTGTSRIPAAADRTYRNLIESNVCNFCNHSDVLDEVHFLTTCEHFRQKRRRLFPSIRDWAPNVIKFYKIMNYKGHANLKAIIQLYKYILQELS